jgi:AraC-like DNA-binding protein
MDLVVSPHLKHSIEVTTVIPGRYQKYNLPGATVKFCKGPFGAFIQQTISTQNYNLSYQVFIAQRKFQLHAVNDKATIALNCTIAGPILCLTPSGKNTHIAGMFDLHYIPGKSKSTIYLEKGICETIVFEIEPKLLSMFVTEYPLIDGIYQKLLHNDKKPCSLESINMGITAKNHINMIFENNQSRSNVFVFNRINEIYLQYFIKINGQEKDHRKVGVADMVEIAEYIKNNYSQVITITELSRIYNIHISTLERDFKKQFGGTVKKYLTDQRMNAAKQYLLFSEMTINEIAINTGYSDVAYFSKKFKSYFKDNPSSFRKANKTNAIDNIS